MKIKKLMLLPMLIGSVHAVAGDGAGCKMPATPPAATALQADFDSYSWQMFAALNWPASTTDRGVPDCTKKLSSSGLKVWQTYKTPDQVFLDNGQSPGSWNDQYNANSLMFSLSSIAKSGKETAIASHNEAVGGWLIDQQGNPTYFQRWVNETWYNYVVKNKLYNSDNFTNSTQIDFPDGATEIKSAWRILTEKDTESNYITQESNVALFDVTGRATGKSTPVTLGLVGLHIVQKATGYPQWIWATFEHNLNVPDSEYDASKGVVVSTPEKGEQYSYYNANAAANTVNQPACGTDGENCLTFTTPNPLARITPIRSDAKMANTTFTSQSPVKDTVLAHYQLITTQWPSQPNNPSVTFGSPTPTISANITMESYIQPTSNCTACHGAASLPGLQAKSDFSFLFNEAHSANKKTN